MLGFQASGITGTSSTLPQAPSSDVDLTTSDLCPLTLGLTPRAASGTGWSGTTGGTHFSGLPDSDVVGASSSAQLPGSAPGRSSAEPSKIAVSLPTCLPSDGGWDGLSTNNLARLSGSDTDRISARLSVYGTHVGFHVARDHVLSDENAGTPMDLDSDHHDTLALPTVGSEPCRRRRRADHIPSKSSRAKHSAHRT